MPQPRPRNLLAMMPAHLQGCRAGCCGRRQLKVFAPRHGGDPAVRETLLYHFSRSKVRNFPGRTRRQSIFIS